MFVKFANCVVKNIEDFNENQPIKIEFEDKRARHNINSLDLSIYADIPSLAFSALLIEVFAELQTLKILNINLSEIKFLSSEKVAPAKHLEEFIFFRCEISEVQSHTFSGFDIITDLLLDYNLLTHIKRDTFVGMPSLTTLKLTHNEIGTIEDGAFDLPKLRFFEIFIYRL